MSHTVEPSAYPAGLLRPGDYIEHEHKYEHHSRVEATCEDADRGILFLKTCGKVFDKDKNETTLSAPDNSGQRAPVYRHMEQRRFQSLACVHSLR